MFGRCTLFLPNAYICMICETGRKNKAFVLGACGLVAHPSPLPSRHGNILMRISASQSALSVSMLPVSLPRSLFVCSLALFSCPKKRNLIVSYPLLFFVVASVMDGDPALLWQPVTFSPL